MSLIQRLKVRWRRRRKGAAAEAGPGSEPAAAAAVEPPAAVDRAQPSARMEAPASPAVDVAAEAIASPSRRAKRRRAKRPANAATRGGVRRIRLALQGGGSHGAFTWGVLERLLQREDIGIEAISGASAGALNGAVLATGWARGGRQGARDALQAFWRDVGHAAGGYLPGALHAASSSLAPTFELDAMPGYEWASRFLRTLSPYDYNPLNINPLREVLAQHVDGDALRHGPIRLFVTATAVRSGEPRVFSGAALDLDALLASACLPFVFQAVEIDGEAYWDGGYSGNPSIHPLLDPDIDGDIVVVRINPAHRDGVPRRSTEIMDRINEITFNASLIAELRTIAQLNRLLRAAAPAAARRRECRLHVIADDVDLATLPASSRLRADLAFVERLHDLGQAAAVRFLDMHADALGRRSSHDPDADATAAVGDALAGERAGRRLRGA